MNKLRVHMPALQQQILAASLRRRKGVLASFLIATFAASLLTVSAPLIFAYAVKLIGQGNAASGPLIGCFVGFALAMAGARFLADVRTVLMNTIEQEVRLQTNKDSLTALLAARGSIFVANNASKISEIVQNLHHSNTIYVQVVLMILLAGAVELILSFFAIAGFVSWTVALFVVVYGVASVWLTLRGNDATLPYQRRARARSNEGANLLGNVVANVVSIKIFRGQRWVLDLYEGYAQAARKEWLRYYWVRLGYGGVQGALVFVQYASIFAMLVLTLKSPDLLNQVVLVSMILLQLNRPFEMIASAVREVTMARVLAETLQNELDDHPAPVARGGGQALPPGRPLPIELDGVSFAYEPDGAPVLSDVSARFAPGRLNFIVGPSGSGKSSLLQILLGINSAYTGAVRVAGLDHGSLDGDAYLGAVGYVPQEPMLMNLSIRDNVLFGRSYPDADVAAVLDAVQLTAKMASLPEGLDFVIGERGQLLSGGERQRLAIARALIGKPQILVLDEASSALDEQTERGIFASLRRLAGTATVVAVTHRLGVIDPSDQVLDLSKQVEPKAEPLPA